ncbi:MAG: hypothetical protein HOM01_15295 [Kordiimonadaceae bacterium]|jgi:hypothetical protein|nr:hypothetical protein [Kordiimonadaceae bacterium]
MSYLGAAYDALRDIMGPKANDQFVNIKPSAGYRGKRNGLIVSPVFTTRGRVVTEPESDPPAYKKLDDIRMSIYREQQDLFRKLKPIVCLEAGDMEVAHTGDITSMIYQKMGSVGMLTDGYTRDMTVIDRIKYPVFSNGCVPIDAIGHWALVDYMCDIRIDDVEIMMGDYVAMDLDGALVIPGEIYKKGWRKKYLGVVAREGKIRDMIDEDEDLDEILKKLGRW